MRKTTVDPKGRTVSQYAMNITRYIQGILTRNNPNYPLKLHSPYVVSYSSSVASFYLNPLCRGGVVLGGGSHPKQPMKLRLVYSRL
jgi:fructose-1,6-bisphosphatase